MRAVEWHPFIDVRFSESVARSAFGRVRRLRFQRARRYRRVQYRRNLTFTNVDQKSQHALAKWEQCRMYDAILNVNSRAGYLSWASALFRFEIWS
jgi:hypothetical protein